MDVLARLETLTMLMTLRKAIARRAGELRELALFRVPTPRRDLPSVA